MQEAEREIKKMTDCLPARRIRGKNGDEMRTKRKCKVVVILGAVCVSDAKP
jgi:hypothetical protein